MITMSHFNNKKQKLLIGATLLAIAPTVKGQGSTEGSKSQRGVNHLTLEEAPFENVTLCIPAKSQTSLTEDFRFLPNKVAVVVPPFETNFVKMTFIVSHVNAGDDDQVLLLAYSQKLLPSPPQLTPKSLNKLLLDLDTVEILGIYDVRAFGREQQPETRVGMGNPSPRIKWEFDINLDTTKIPTMMNSGNDTIYVQAALLKRAHWEAGRLDNMILSEVDTITFIPYECPETMVFEEGESPQRAEPFPNNSKPVTMDDLNIDG
jgi:hypothetical protein